MDTLSEKALELRRAYQRNYRKANPDKVKKWRRDFWERKAQRADQVSSSCVNESPEQTDPQKPAQNAF